MTGGLAAGRVLAERGLRGVALGALALALWQRLTPQPVPNAARVERADERGLSAALARWTATPARAVDVRLDSLPDPVTRAWLAALAAAGTHVAWRAAQGPALAASAEAVADPAGGTRLFVAAPAGAKVEVADALGALDSARIAGGAGAATITLALPGGERVVRAHALGAAARVRVPAAPRLGTVLLVARAGWEGKFAAAALEERGWTVRTRFALAPAVLVGANTLAASTTASATRGAPNARPTSTAAPRADTIARPTAVPLPRLDTTTIAAVIALDSSIAPLSVAVARYVRAGGGLVLAGDAALVPALATLAPAAPGPAVDDSAGRVRPLERPRADAVPLAWRRVDGARTLVAAARRVGTGRVVQLADVESWRRRMQPAANAAVEHRAWWAQVVAAAAYAPAIRAAGPDGTAPNGTAPNAAAPSESDTASRLSSPAVDPAPLAATVAALGAPARPADAHPDALASRPAVPRRLPSDAVLVPLALAALLGEVASRRLRGAG